LVVTKNMRRTERATGQNGDPRPGQTLISLALPVEARQVAGA
jgi:hypothetical protein